MHLQDKKCFFQNELLEMKEEGFVDEQTYNNIQQASNEFYSEKAEIFKNSEADYKRTSYKTQQIDKQTIRRKVLSEQQVAERKASVLLNLGVIFLFLSGLIFATTNWASLELMGKILSVTFMGGILYIGSHIAEKKLKLQKTGFALWVLTTLYIPIVGITFTYSLMWNKGIEVANPKSLLALGCIGIISTVVNILSLKKYHNKYYIWASYVTCEISLLFLIASLKINKEKIVLVTVLCVYAVLLVYMKLTSEDYKRYTRQYLMVLNEVTLLLVLFIGANVISTIPYITSLILMIVIAIYNSYAINDKYIGITLILFLPLKTLEYCTTLHLDMAVYLIPAVIILGMQYLSHKGKLDRLVGYLAVGMSFVLFNIVLISDTLFYTLGSIGICISALMLYKGIKLPKYKVVDLNNYHHILLPIYTYVLIARLPFILFNMTHTEQAVALSVSAIILCLIQYGISNKFNDMKLAYSRMSIIILMLNGFNALLNEYLAISLLLALAIFEVIGLYKKLNLVAYIINLFVGTTILVTMLKYNLDIVTITVLFGVVATMLIIAYINKQDRKYILFYTSVFMPISLAIINGNSVITAVIITSIVLGALSLIVEESNSLLILGLTLAYGIGLIIDRNLAKTSIALQLVETISISIESIFAIVLSLLGSKFFKEFRADKKYDSLTLTAIIIISLLTLLKADSYIGILITTISALCIIGANYRKLSTSVVLKLFLVLKLITSYMQILMLSQINIGDGILIIPLLTLAVCSRYYIFKDNNIGYILERVSLSVLVLKLLVNVMNFDITSTMVITTIGIIVLVISYTKKVKVYFITAIAMIVLPLIKGSLDFWLLIPWWAYLLIVGITLLTMGSIAEKNKKNHKSLKDLKDKFFKDWN